ncbi:MULTISPECIES: oxaloacetate decarboxylase [unclassified Herbaspirillum]|uniref:isocitrate lyase/PEP mutase family protein n=1 Tax=unclassified Herbaspirillum TaxID=2624150 RepID=UPI0011505D34|nr:MULTISPECIES: isocitrate lyase/PEP mutase family protein [unclassified Herbaspirillum]MBB5391741.1 2-methylisocitrate lyase-like PEP mutase family enzyme [Herbaspirillum sp. SJZ102]TQK03013.1 2,3-dimethylmalate lyase [Herbaspirillum sp. SJZ130]TQK06599.1 2,3-dimethylmalate lyase [Herbaspirillum sp. SJZ106]
MTSTSLAQRLRQPGIVVAPGCHDALGARIYQQAGFEAVYMTGNGLSASLLGAPDIGLLGMSEMVERGRAFAAAVDVPVIADADTGYGNLNNVARTVQGYEAAGVQAIHLEDQVTPKKCGAMKGLALVSMEEHAEKIRIAVATRKSADFLIIGRSDARIPLGLDEALARGRAYAAAGADLVLLEMLQSEEEMRRALSAIDAPLMFNAVDGKTPPLNAAQFERLGFRLLSFPISATLAYTHMMQRLAEHIRATGSAFGVPSGSAAIADYEAVLGLERYQ